MHFWISSLHWERLYPCSVQLSRNVCIQLNILLIIITALITELSSWFLWYMFVMMVPFQWYNWIFGELVDSLIKMTKPTEAAICTKISNCVEVFGNEQMVRSLAACYISFKPGFIASPDRLYIFEISYVIRKI